MGTKAKCTGMVYSKLVPWSYLKSAVWLRCLHTSSDGAYLAVTKCNKRIVTNTQRVKAVIQKWCLKSIDLVYVISMHYFSALVLFSRTFSQQQYILLILLQSFRLCRAGPLYKKGNTKEGQMLSQGQCWQPDGSENLTFIHWLIETTLGSTNDYFFLNTNIYTVTCC